MRYVPDQSDGAEVTFTNLGVESGSSGSVAFSSTVIVYFAVLFLTKGLTHNDMLNFPMGLRIEKIAKKLHLMSCIDWCQK